MTLPETILDLSSLKIVDSDEGVFIDVDQTTNLVFLQILLGDLNILACDGLISDLNEIATSQDLNILVDQKYNGSAIASAFPGQALTKFHLAEVAYVLLLNVVITPELAIELESEIWPELTPLSYPMTEFIDILEQWKVILINHNQG